MTAIPYSDEEIEAMRAFASEDIDMIGVARPGFNPRDAHRWLATLATLPAAGRAEAMEEAAKHLDKMAAPLLASPRGPERWDGRTFAKAARAIRALASGGR